MTDRFSDMVKLPEQPAAKLLAAVTTKLETPLEAPASATTDVVMAELDSKEAVVDMLRLMSIALPPRERVWWACLAARDIVGPGEENATPALKAAEAWVFKPTDENRELAAEAVLTSDQDDETLHVANSVVYSTGKLGVGDMAEFPAPAGAAEIMAFAMNGTALSWLEGDFYENAQMLIDRAIDIARGGNGRLDNGDAVEES